MNYNCVYSSLTQNFRDQTDTPRDFLERCLDVVDSREDIVRAWVVIDQESARKEADGSTSRWREGRPKSPIDGMPIGIKDVLETWDMPTQMGCEAYSGNFPKRDNVAVWALREAGAIILGKTVTAELAVAEPGPTTNPFDAKRTPGGSSSGSAAAVATGMVPASIGTQVGGSIIRPASFCGTWALKPSQGAINRGAERQETSMTTHGVIANDVEDMWTVAMEISSRIGGDPGWLPLLGPKSPPLATRPESLAVLETEGWGIIDDATRSAFEVFISRIESSGVRILRRNSSTVIAELEDALVGAQELADAITAWENYFGYQDILITCPDKVSDRTKSRWFRVVETLGVDGYAELLRIRSRVRGVYRGLAGLVDGIVQLSAPGVAPLWLGDVQGQEPSPRPTGNTVFNIPSSLLGAPAVTVPKLTIDGLPVGIQFVGQPGAYARMASIARWAYDCLDSVACET